MTAEKIFNNNAREQGQDVEQFKKTFPILYKTVIDSMEDYARIKLEIEAFKSNYELK